MRTAFENRKPPLPYAPEDYLSGRVSLPPWFQFKRQRFYAYAFQNVFTTAPVSNEITLDGDSFFLLEGINIVSTANNDDNLSINVQFSDTSKGQPWSIGNLSFRNTTGRGDNTKFFTQPTLIRPSTSVIFSINNTSSVPVYGTLIGRKIYGLTENEARFLLRRMWYQYDILLGPLAASATDIFQVQTYADSDFYLWKMFCSQGISLVNTELVNTQNPADIVLTLRDATANKNLMNKQTPIRNIAGSMLPIQDNDPTPSIFTLGDAIRFPIPMKIRRNSTLIAEVTNQNATTSLGTTPLNYTLEGCRVFD